MHSIYLFVCDSQEILFRFGEIMCRPAVGGCSLESSSSQNGERPFGSFLGAEIVLSVAIFSDP